MECAFNRAAHRHLTLGRLATTHRVWMNDFGFVVLAVE
jgi:hypothetical protein